MASCQWMISSYRAFALCLISANFWLSLSWLDSIFADARGWMGGLFRMTWSFQGKCPGELGRSSSLRCMGNMRLCLVGPSPPSGAVKSGINPGLRFGIKWLRMLTVYRCQIWSKSGPGWTEPNVCRCQVWSNPGPRFGIKWIRMPTVCRCQVWSNPGPPVGIKWLRITQALVRPVHGEDTPGPGPVDLTGLQCGLWSRECGFR